MPIRFFPVFFIIVCLFIPKENFATHLRAGEITVQRISCTSLTFSITVTVYIDTESGIRFGGADDWLDFGDGNRILVPETPTVPRPDLGENIGMASYNMIYTYAGYGNYIISYSEPFRNDLVRNMDNSVHTKFEVTTAIFLDPFFSCNQNLPELLVPPIDRACTGVAFFHNPGAFDLDGDSLSFEIGVPGQAVNYKDPNDAAFYLDYEAGNETKNGKPTFSIDPLDGTLKWDAPGANGEYNIAFRIIEWRKDPLGEWNKMGFVTRDMQIIVEDCDNGRPDLIIPDDTCVVAGTILEETIFGIDPENDEVKIEVFSEVLEMFVSPATFTPFPPGFQPSTPPAALHFRWETNCEHVKDQYYQVVFKITDTPANGPKLVTFKTWRIKVVGPPPEWKDVVLDLTKRSATVEWDNYDCDNASQMQVWRKVDGFSFSPDNCQTGMPDFLGYSLIAIVPLTDPVTNQPVNKFVDTNNDKGLAPGARYCYRLVAIFPEPKGGESYLSKDTCLAPIQADAPVITNVTVEETSSTQGSIRVRWYGPFEINKTQFPGPYEYAVYRANGFEGGNATVVTPAGRIKDTTFVDTNLNTQLQVYNYRIVLYSNTTTDLFTWIPVDTSAIASSVRLEAKALTDKIDLTWKAEVPWSNASEGFPYHLIYRGAGVTNPEDFILIDSVSVVENGLGYTDQGQFQNIPIDKDQTYCYRILTRGVYGNDKIAEPMENFSQVICLKPDDNEKPCAPVLALTPVDCNEVFTSALCQVNDFSNRIYWNTSCDTEVSGYRIYAAAGAEREFSLIADNVKEMFYTDTNLLSFARCYKITAVDMQGNESDFSEIICNDNCPYFELPNVFTPNGDECNEYFSAYGTTNPFSQDAPESCSLGYNNYAKCARFVKEVSFRVFNRWGKEVYSFKSGEGDRSIFINWDGKDKEGKWLSSGVYFYQASVTFDSIDPEMQHQTLKGWVQLLR